MEIRKFLKGRLIICVVLLLCHIIVVIDASVSPTDTSTDSGLSASSNEPGRQGNGSSTYLPTFTGARNFPLCITSQFFQEYNYQSEIKGTKYQNDFVSFIKRFENLKVKKVSQSACPNCPAGLLSEIKFYRLKTNVDIDLQVSGKYREHYGWLRQWMHIEVITTVPVTQLVIQGHGWPACMPWGVFDIEFATKNCGGDYPVNKALTGNALDLQGQAAVIPCRRRSYLHNQHPYVYVYSGPPRNSFHMNYKFMDMTCYEIEMLQFMLLIGVQNTISIVKTAVIDHTNHDSSNGEPAPFTVDLINNVTTHGSSLVWKLPMIPNGDVTSLPVNKEFDDCIIGSDSYLDTGDLKVSDWICRDPPRHACAFRDPGDVAGQEGEPYENDLEKGGGTALCRICSTVQNEYTQENTKRLIQRTFVARRFHGYVMILGGVHLLAISNYVARYLKETKGISCLLVGSWLWAHLGLSFLAVLAQMAGVGKLGPYALGAFMPARRGNRPPIYSDARDIVIAVHHLAGIATVVLFVASWVTGPVRPIDEEQRHTWMVLHAAFGHGTVVVAVISVFISTACVDVKIFLWLAVLAGVIVYTVSLFLEKIIDRKVPLVPKRKYFPVIEAVAVPKKPPLLPIRLGLLAGYVIITAGLFFLTFAKGSYGGLLGQSPCYNCIYKYDESIAAVFNETTQTTSVTPFFVAYDCAITDISYGIAI